MQKSQVVTCLSYKAVSKYFPFARAGLSVTAQNNSFVSYNKTN